MQSKIKIYMKANVFLARYGNFYGIFKINSVFFYISENEKRHLHAMFFILFFHVLMER